MHYNLVFLVVDDMESNRLVLCELLKPVGFDICEASNGLEALEQYERWAPDAVLMDMRMPIMDGYEATRRLRKSDSDSGKKPVIIAITASAFEHQQAQVLAAGVDAYLRKPFRPEELFAALGSALGLRYVHMEEALAFGRGRGERKAPAGLSSLPRKLILAMRQAVEEGDTMRLIPLILAAEAIDPSAATGLRALANDYDYTKLEEWLNKEEGDNG